MRLLFTAVQVNSITSEGDFESVICQYEGTKLGSTREILALIMGLKRDFRKSNATSVDRCHVFSNHVFSRDKCARVDSGWAAGCSYPRKNRVTLRQITGKWNALVRSSNSRLCDG